MEMVHHKQQPRHLRALARRAGLPRHYIPKAMRPLSTASTALLHATRHMMNPNQAQLQLARENEELRARLAIMEAGVDRVVDRCVTDGFGADWFAEGHIAEVMRFFEKHDIKAESLRLVFHKAVKGGHMAMAELLISKGAPPNGQDDHGYSPLHIAASRGHVAMATFLLSKGAQVNLKDKEGETPLHWAIWVGRPTWDRNRPSEFDQVGVIQVLLDAGADINLPDAKGETPLQLAGVVDAAILAALLAHAG